MFYRTDFEECGLSEGHIQVHGRFILLTVDFEAFTPEMMPIWEEAMQYWSECAQRYRIHFCFFLSVEDIVRLRALDTVLYEGFKDKVKSLNRSGSLFYAHNHGVFDPYSGAQIIPSRVLDGPPLSYNKRVSMFYDAVYRHGLDLTDWLKTVNRLHKEFLSDADCTEPRMSVFRAGGWDYGSSCNDLRQYMNAVVDAGFCVDSSACRGKFGTPSWQVGTAFGVNVIGLAGGLVEVAPCWSVDCSMEPISGSYMGTIFQLRKHRMLWTGEAGVFVVVLHFDHLFHNRSNGLCYFAIKDIAIVRKRIERLFRLLTFIRSILRLKCATFDEVVL